MAIDNKKNNVDFYSWNRIEKSKILCLCYDYRGVLEERIQKSLENWALLKQISERRIYRETPEAAATSHFTGDQRQPWSSSVSEANSFSEREATLAVFEE